MDLRAELKSEQASVLDLDLSAFDKLGVVDDDAVVVDDDDPELLAELAALTGAAPAPAKDPAALRAEALARAAAQTPMEWSRVSAQVRVGLYHGTGGVAAIDVPLEWPLAGARVRVVGLAGLAPAVVAAAAQRVDPGGYESVAAALRATEDALAKAGHVSSA